MTNSECAGITISTSLLFGVVCCAFGHLYLGELSAHKEAIKHRAGLYIGDPKDGSSIFRWRDELTDAQKQLLDAIPKEVK